MDYISLIYLLSMFSIAITDAHVLRNPPCLAEKNRYYHKHQNKCRMCDKCLAGEGTNLTEPVEVNEIFGALRCKPCITCPVRMYNPRRAFKCKPCKDCAASGRTVKIACAPDRNEVCGKRIKDNSTAETSQVPPTIFHEDYKNNEDAFTLYRDNALVICLIFMAFVISTVFVANLCRRAIHGYSIQNTGVDGQPIMQNVDSGCNTSSVVSAARPYDPQPNPVRRWSNSISPTADIEAIGDDDFSDTKCKHLEPSVYNLQCPTETMDENVQLSSDVEEDAAPIVTMINESVDTTDRVDPIRYSPCKGLTPAGGKRRKDHAELKKVIEKVSKYIAPNDNYQILGRHLNVSTTDIDIIRDDYSGAQERGYRTLQKWWQCNPKATVDDLKNAIRDIGRKDILDKI
ncbi:uncharacterized protein LOC132547085 [Ylistrum balloti]|uniref:uncharacterized protein LOC132547085 n=1 Tax=Ylistrum balloti TaxID=509963 RepID=UPI002905ED1B|nr:uncharacterized protein LOC132547085 [Ylistrum balloti]